MENAGASHCCVPRTGTPGRRRRSGSASWTRTSAPRSMPDRSEWFPGGAGSAPPPGAAVLSRRDVLRRPSGRPSRGKDAAMETVTRFVDRQSGSASMASTPSADAARTLTATASYLLSEDGRKASLLSGGDGRSVQQITLQVPANRLHLVSVDKQGVARLKLRPRFEMDTTGIVRIDTAPIYDVPPTVDELYRAAAKNHELEAAYHVQRTTLRAKRTDDERARR